MPRFLDSKPLFQISSVKKPSIALVPAATQAQHNDR
jgi:hypothetical protein